jgi:hypothetical protein
MPRHARVYVLLLTALSAGCARPATLRTSGPFDIDRAPSEGLRYYVTRDLVTVDAKVSTHHDVVPSRTHAGCEPRDSTATSWTVTVTTVPDRRQAYRLGLRPSATVEQTFGVKLTETGVLTGLNYSGADQRAAIVTTIAKGAAGVLGSLLPRGPQLARDSSCAALARVANARDSTVHVMRTFDLTELPAAPEENLTFAQLSQSLADAPRARELFAQTHLFVAVSPLPEPRGARPATPPADSSAIACAGDAAACARIYYREPVTRAIRIYVADGADEARAHYLLREEKLVPLVSASDPILHLAFDTHSFGAGKVALAFGVRGNIIGVEQSASAALSGAAAAGTNAVGDALTAYTSALQARVDRLDLELKAVKDDAALRKARAADTLTSTP